MLKTGVDRPLSWSSTVALRKLSQQGRSVSRRAAWKVLEGSSDPVLEGSSDPILVVKFVVGIFPGHFNHQKSVTKWVCDRLYQLEQCLLDPPQGVTKTGTFQHRDTVEKNCNCFPSHMTCHICLMMKLCFFMFCFKRGEVCSKPVLFSPVSFPSDIPRAGGGCRLRSFLRGFQPSGVPLRPGGGLHR